MSKLIPLKVPLVNPNEEEAVLASLEVVEGGAISQGDRLSVFETTKSTFEMIAEAEGFLVGLMAQVGDALRVGQVWAYVGDSPQARDEKLPPWTVPIEADANLPESLRISQPALVLARQHGIDLASLPHDRMVTSNMIERMISKSVAQPGLERWITSPANQERRLLVYGAGGHGRSLVELIRLLPGYQIEGFVDDGYQGGEQVSDLPVFGDGHLLNELFSRGIALAVNGVGGIGNFQQRLDVYLALREAGFFCPSVVHPFAFLEASAVLSDAVQVFPFAYVGSQVQIGYGSIINTGAIVSHDCQLGELSNLSPGATLAGGVMLGERTLIGMRATVNLGVRIGAGARVGNGATVKADVPENGLVPAGAVWPLRG